MIFPIASAKTEAIFCIETEKEKANEQCRSYDLSKTEKAL